MLQAASRNEEVLWARVRSDLYNRVETAYRFEELLAYAY